MLATTKLVVEEMEAGTNIKGLKDHDIVDFELWVFYFCVIFHSSPFPVIMGWGLGSIA